MLALLTVLHSSGVTGSGETHTLRFLADWVLWLSSHSKKELRMASQVKALHILPDPFRNAKTVSNLHRGVVAISNFVSMTVAALNLLKFVPSH